MYQKINKNKQLKTKRAEQTKLARKGLNLLQMV